ncbi:MAG: hypothetical protein JOZ78_06555 [Chroococcidiopsidaceae cyanobacterium CP_BM_ER_R8_30]|nr:hypothetical protein [Chroococcidiopsidaceae cyanobacterium CP_BM_ER_R8_30]
MNDRVLTAPISTDTNLIFIPHPKERFYVNVCLGSRLMARWFCLERGHQHLEAKGHRAFAPTIAGHGKGVNKNVNHAQCTQSIVDYIVDKDLTDIVLLGHSFGRTIIAKVAEAISGRIRRLIFFAAFVPRDGESLIDNVPPDYQAVFNNIARASDDNTIMMPFELWRDAFVNDADLELARSSYAQLSPEPYQPSIEKLDLQQFTRCRFPKVTSIVQKTTPFLKASGDGIRECLTAWGDFSLCKCPVVMR